MSYRLEASEPLPDGLRRIAIEQIDDALIQLTEQPEGRDEAVHEARKSFKKVRAVLRLVRDEFGEDCYKQENVAFRDAGRRLSAVRDSAVMIETLGDLANDGHMLDSELVMRVTQRLHYAHEYLSDRVLEQERTLDVVIDATQQARQRVAHWPIEQNDFSALVDGLQRVYRRGRHRFADAYAHLAPDRFHAWRKRSKYLWYHMRILKPLWPELLDALADDIHVLSDYLGDDHDLAVFHDKVSDLPEMDGSQAARELTSVIQRKRAELQAEARPLGVRIFSEKPKRFVGRFRDYWDAMHLETNRNA